MTDNHQQAVIMIGELTARLGAIEPPRIWPLDTQKPFHPLGAANFTKLGERYEGISFFTDGSGPPYNVVTDATWIIEIVYTNKAGKVTGIVVAHLAAGPDLESLEACIRGI